MLRGATSASRTVCANRIAGMIIGHDRYLGVALGVGDMSDELAGA